MPVAKNLHYRKMPDFIIRKSGEIVSPYQIVATSILIKEEQILAGEYAHLGIIMAGGDLSYKSTLSPTELQGRFAKKNKSGYDIVHRDRDKIRKSYSWDVPNFGDPDRGYHEISVTRLVYPRTHIAPREWSIAIELLSEEIVKECRVFTFKISVDTILSKNEPRFYDDLFFAINLLQENTFSCDVFDAEATQEEFLRTRQVGWEIFPAGSLERIIAKTRTQVGDLPRNVETKIQHRYEFLLSLNPKNFIVGYGMNRRYFGAQFSENLVVFENIEYGNAIYILFDNWTEISQMSRVEILQRKEKDFVRLPHSKNWERVLKHNIDKLLK